MPKFVHKPTVVEAVQWWPPEDPRHADIPGIVPLDGTGEVWALPDRDDEPGEYCVYTRVLPGDWILPEPGGCGRYVCRQGKFEDLYDPYPGDESHAIDPCPEPPADAQ